MADDEQEQVRKWEEFHPFFNPDDAQESLRVYGPVVSLHGRWEDDGSFALKCATTEKTFQTLVLTKVAALTLRTLLQPQE